MPSAAPSFWTYGRTAGRGGLEQAVWQGAPPAGLAAHFHREAQVTVVLAGTRRFLTRHGPVAAHAGEILLIPPGAPHQPLGLAGPAVSRNLYLALPDAPPAGRPVVVATPRWLDSTPCPRMLADWVAEMIGPAGAGPDTAAGALTALVLGSRAPIAALAPRAGLTREGLIRRFTRLVGMTPHAYRLAHQLNAARAELARGTPPPPCAMDAGFADQSHLSRRFKAAFGITPGTYRAAMGRPE
ncbi:AraC family transcriptional regulator [Azorhizobium doebereinerae]|uniref:AraC family transcriptional regulator n=1 Tax=Azorhizobium doebereinerae TaxID=281091 RepID=UPI0004293B0A|nr:helix-turn-helix domain-containing protein [Azorhizobium doebereinerae]